MRQKRSDDLKAFLPILEQAFHALERKLPAPELVPLPTPMGIKNFPRYRQQTAQIAALQKLARYISGLHAIVVLLENHLLQEDGTIKRMLDELGEDILFLIFEPKSDADKKLRERYLSNFYMETFEVGGTSMDLVKRPKEVTRPEIRDYLAAQSGTPDPLGPRASKALYQAYSGYVHSNSPHLMEMWDFETKQFELAGSKDISLQQSHIGDASNHFVRGFYSLAALAMALGDKDLFQVMSSTADRLAGIPG